MKLNNKQWDNMNTILLDCDGVILDYFSVIHEKHDHLVNTENRPTLFNDFNCYFNIGAHTVNKLVTEFNDSPEFALLPAYQNAKEVLNSLYDDGFEIIVVTSCGDKKHIIDRRIQNLHSEIGDIFEDIICLPLEADKKDILSKWKNTNNIWVDDRLHNCETGLEVGLDSLMYETLYNHYIDFPKAEEWLHLHEIIKDKYYND